MLLNNKKALITGIASNRSIAYGIAKKLSENGAEEKHEANAERWCDDRNDLSAMDDQGVATLPRNSHHYAPTCSKLKSLFQEDLGRQGARQSLRRAA